MSTIEVHGGHGHDHGTGSGRTLHALAPVAALAATWAVRKGLNMAYRGLTGTNAPAADAPGLSFRRVLLWSATTAVAAAVVEVVVYRAINRR